MRKCIQCGKELEGKWQKKFCSISCSASFNNRGINRHGTNKKYCKFCGKELVYKQRANKYCGTTCYWDDKNYKYINRWKLGLETGSCESRTSNYIRNYLFDKYNSSCQLCGWSNINPITKKVPLQIHHIDGNWKNNRPDNLQLLCPNCHSVTPTYGILNKGHGRRLYRMKYHEEKI